MTTDHAASVQGVALRVTKLDAAGAPLTGTHSSFVTSGFMKLGWTPEYTSGDEVEEKAADGTVCVYFQTLDVLKRVTLTLDICGPDPDLTALMVGGTVIDDPDNPGDSIGYVAPTAGHIATPNGVSIEIWSKAVVGGRIAAVNPYWHFVFPYAQMKADGERTLENGMMANSFTGWGLGNDEWDDGPAHDWEFASSAPYQYVREATAPTGVNDFVAVTA